MRAHQVGAVLAVVALTALAAPAQATICKAGMKCVDKLWMMKCLAGNMKVSETSSATWVTLKNDDCFMLGKDNAVDLISVVQTGGKTCKKARTIAFNGKITSFKLPKGSKELKFKLYAVDTHFGTGKYAAAPKESKCLDRNSQRCDLCSYDLTIPIDGSIFCNRAATCPSKGCLPGVCKNNKCGLGLPDDGLCGDEGCNIGVCSDKGACSLQPGPDCDECDDNDDCDDEDVDECQKAVCKQIDGKRTCVVKNLAAGASCDDGDDDNCDDKCNNAGECAGQTCPEEECGQDWQVCCTEERGRHVPGFCVDPQLECVYDNEEEMEKCMPCGYDDLPACTGNPEVPTGCRDEDLSNVDGICLRIPECGLKWQTCCETDDEYPSKCKDHGFGCIGRTCTECGIEWRPACPGIEHPAGFCLDDNLAVANDGTCQKCGGVGRPPCARGKCTAKYTILDDNVCEPCGDTNRLCCAHNAKWEECRDDADMCMQGTCMRAGGSD